MDQGKPEIRPLERTRFWSICQTYPPAIDMWYPLPIVWAMTSGSQHRVNYFKVLSIATALLYLYLFATLMISPASIFSDFGIEDSEGIGLLSKRTAMLMLGFSALLFFVRNTPASAVRGAIAAAVGINMAGFASNSIYAYVWGSAKIGVLPAFAIELTIACAFFAVFISDRYKHKVR